ncbi:hypothetical protein VAPA_1c07500 [Variovorax paradoxus B4]|uniref:Integrase n=1 Tax=Variovorax paradoxus B4 TaxID=1246301 RepID=T1X6A5_VARPD|nr:hypothetical protein VAPA_1c07500 [Variovorax paradoxus B4]
MGQLNELQIKAAAPRNKEYLLADGDGLYLRVRPTGKRGFIATSGMARRPSSASGTTRR